MIEGSIEYSYMYSTDCESSIILHKLFPEYYNVRTILYRMDEK